MSIFLKVIGVLAFLLVTTVSRPAAGQATDAASMLKEFSAIQPPHFDRSKAGDRDYAQQFSAAYQAALHQRMDIARDFARRFPDHASTPSMLLFVAQMTHDNKAEQLSLYRQIVEKYPDSQAAQVAAGPIRQAESIGKPFSISFTDAITGRKIDSASLKGKIVVIDFWATWCGPCCAEMPKNKELYAKFKNQGVEFIGVSLDQPESHGGLIRLKDFVAQNQINWPQFYQGNGWQSEFSRSWGVNAIPQMFLIDANGNLVATDARGRLEILLPQLLATGKIDRSNVATIDVQK